MKSINKLLTYKPTKLENTDSKLPLGVWNFLSDLEKHSMTKQEIQKYFHHICGEATVFEDLLNLGLIEKIDFSYSEWCDLIKTNNNQHILTSSESEDIITNQDDNSEDEVMFSIE